MYLRFMITVSVIGTGNVGSHLIKAFLNSTSCKLVQVYSRKKKKIEHLEGSVSVTTELSKLKPSDVTLIAVSDDAIKLVADSIPKSSTLLVHTSGTVGLRALDSHDNIGVFYPLQSISSEKKVNFRKVPFCLETRNDVSLLVLEKLAGAISNNVYFIDSEQRKKIHLAAVFVNNFTNHMVQQAANICEDYNVPFDILKPLLKETFKKLKTQSPLDAQTGPARRKDYKTIKSQLNQLNDQQKEIYKTITDSIIKTYK